MKVSRFVAADLVCSGASVPPSIRGIGARFDARQMGSVILSYTLLADMDQLRVPSAARPRRVDGLWQHTCFEAFIGVQDSPAYVEYNFSPSGEWAVYQFRAYRDGGSAADEALAPNISTERGAERLTLTASLRINRLALIQTGSTLRIGLSAVIETRDGALSYWALKHPSAKPDFHHADSFALQLALPGASA